MKILVVSDTHGHGRLLSELIDRLAQSVELVCHLGDGCDDVSPFISKYKNLSFLRVRGNCDFGGAFEDSIYTIVAKNSLWLSHGHRSSVKAGLKRIYADAEERGADICLFGHTHEHYLENKNGILFMNPGSLSFPRGADCPTYGILDIGDTVEGAIMGIRRDGVIYRVI